MLLVMLVPADRTLVDLLGDLRVTWRWRPASVLVKPQAGLLERKTEVIQKSARLAGLVRDESFVAQDELALRELAVIMLHQVEHGGQVIGNILRPVVTMEAVSRR